MPSDLPVPDRAGAGAVTVIGNVNVDLIVRPASALPPPGQEWVVESLEARPGGAAVNSALTLARLGLAPRLLGSVGEDHFGRFLLDTLERDGLAGGLTVAAGATGVSIAFEAPDRERSFLTSLGNLALFDRSGVPQEALGCRFVLLCGYFLLPALRGGQTRDLLREARRRGATTVFDPGWDPAGWPAQTRSELAGLLPLVDVFMPNEGEATGVAGDPDLRSAALAIQAVSRGWVVVKRGPAGCLAAGPDGEVLEAPAPRVEVVDTAGAGDAFNSGLIVALVEGASMSDAVRFAVRVASTVVSRPSTRRHPERPDLVSWDGST